MGKETRLTTKELKKEISKISDLYFLALKNYKRATISDSKRTINEYEKFILRVRRAFSSLDSIDKELINNDFFYQAYEDWWIKKYSRSTYYRLKARSMFRFKEAFDNED